MDNNFDLGPTYSEELYANLAVKLHKFKLKLKSSTEKKEIEKLKTAIRFYEMFLKRIHKIINMDIIRI